MPLISNTDLLFAALVGVITIGFLGYRFMTEPIPKQKIKLYPPKSSCPFCYKRKTLRVKSVCTQISHQEGCEITVDHSHIYCSNCKAEYLERPKAWYD